MRNPFRSTAPAVTPEDVHETPDGTTPDSTTLTTRADRRALSRSSRRVRLTVVAAATAVAFVGTGAVTYGHANKTVTLDVDGSTRDVTTTAGSVAGALDAAGIDVDDRDAVAPDPTQPLRDGADVVVRTGKKVTVEADGKASDVWLTSLDADEALDTLASRGDDVSLVASRSGDRASLGIRLDTDGPVEVVADGETSTVPDGGAGADAVLGEAGVDLGELDRVRVRTVADDTDTDTDTEADAEADTAGTSDEQADDVRAQATSADSADDAPAVALVVQRVEVKREKSTTALPFETVEKTDSARYTDDPAVVKQEGKKGTRTTVADVTLVDGSQESSDVVSDEVTAKPVDKVVVRGTKERPKDPKTIGKRMAAERGWTGAQWQCLDNLWTKESGWSTTADNPTSSAYGIPQSLPGSKMASKGSDWATNPATQIAWGLDYIAGSYGSPCGAWSHSQSVNWY